MSLSHKKNEALKEKFLEDGITLPSGKKVELIDGEKALCQFGEHLISIWQEKQHGFRTGIKEIDEKTGGFQPGLFWTIAGMSSMGKTALTLQMILNALKEGAHCMFFCMEMNPKQMMARAVSQQGKVNLSRLTKHRSMMSPGVAYNKNTPYTNENGEANGRTVVEHIKKIAADIADLNPIFIDDPYLDILEIKEVIESYNRNVQKLDIVVADYLQLVHSVDSSSREREVANVSNMLKKLAVGEDLCVIAPVQLNEQQKVRESRVIEQDSNVLIKILLDQKKFDKDGTKDCIGIDIYKNRDGEKTLEPLPIFLKGQYQTFERNDV